MFRQTLTKCQRLYYELSTDIDETRQQFSGKCGPNRTQMIQVFMTFYPRWWWDSYQQLKCNVFQQSFGATWSPPMIPCRPSACAFFHLLDRTCGQTPAWYCSLHFRQKYRRDLACACVHSAGCPPRIPFPNINMGYPFWRYRPAENPPPTAIFSKQKMGFRLGRIRPAGGLLDPKRRICLK